MAPRQRNNKGKGVSSGEDQAQAVPTEEEWAKMKTWASFTISDADNNIHKFMRGQTATVLPHHIAPGTDIFDHDGDTKDVWVKVQWFYSPDDVAGAIKSFNTNACSPYERISSDHFDIVSSEAFNDIIDVHELKDDNVDQLFIDPETFHSRYAIERKNRRLHPKPGADSCTCKKPYCFSDDSTVMHFCPRPSCRKWYHQSCLVKAKSQAPNKKDRPHRLLATSPTDDKHVALSEFCLQPPAKRRKYTHSRGAAKEKDNTALVEALSALPRELLRVAEQPIVRGSLYLVGGVSGNVRPVVQARQLVYEVLGGSDLPKEWEERVLGQVTAITLDDAIVRVKGMRSLPPLLCPQCQSAI